MSTIEAQTTVTESLARDMPQLRPLLGHRVRVIAQDLERPTGEEASTMSFDDFLATRTPWPEDRPSLSLEDMDAAIVKGALGGADV
jgi:hypothetical protein